MDTKKLSRRRFLKTLAYGGTIAAFSSFGFWLGWETRNESTLPKRLQNEIELYIKAGDWETDLYLGNVNAYPERVGLKSPAFALGRINGGAKPESSMLPANETLLKDKKQDFMLLIDKRYENPNLNSEMEELVKIVKSAMSYLLPNIRVSYNQISQDPHVGHINASTPFLDYDFINAETGLEYDDAVRTRYLMIRERPTEVDPKRLGQAIILGNIGWAWVDNISSLLQPSFMSTVVHEYGHELGLPHSASENSVMFKFRLGGTSFGGTSLSFEERDKFIFNNILNSQTELDSEDGLYRIKSANLVQPFVATEDLVRHLRRYLKRYLSTWSDNFNLVTNLSPEQDEVLIERGYFSLFDKPLAKIRIRKIIDEVNNPRTIVIPLP